LNKFESSGPEDGLSEFSVFYKLSL